MLAGWGGGGGCNGGGDGGGDGVDPRGVVLFVAVVEWILGSWYPNNTDEPKTSAPGLHPTGHTDGEGGESGQWWDGIGERLYNGEEDGGEWDRAGKSRGEQRGGDRGRGRDWV